MDTRRKTKILATLGPASDTAEIIERLILAGADGFRLNFSHGDHDYFRHLAENVRAVSEKVGKRVAILQDLQGPKIRTGKLAEGKPVHLIPGARFVITTRPIEGNAMIVSTSYSGLPNDVQPGDKILVDDGAIELKVLQVHDTDVETEIVTGGPLNEKQGINLPGVNVSAQSLTEKDRVDALFGKELSVDYAALSFVRSAADVQKLREVLNPTDSRIIAKIEKPQAVKNLSEILEVSDGVMVARGDLGVELPAERIPLLQKMIIEQANRAEKLVITATEMLESMVDHARPTRAEASDVANAILDGTDVLMLSQETAVGLYPEKAVKTMASIAEFTESDEDVFRNTERIRPQHLVNFTHAIVHSARMAAEVMKAKAILVFTQSGYTAELASCQRPPCPIFAFTPHHRVLQLLSLVWGVYPILVENLPDTNAMMHRAEQKLLEKKLLQKGDAVVI
ncbi:pyruvate kinase, partial [bacterium]|nr:pyruvate kinase [bacterium]